MPSRAVLILHGWQGSGPDHWQSWLARELQATGDAVRYPDLPDCDEPCPDHWGAALHQELRALRDAGGERIVVAHSLGCVLWLREAERVAQEDRVDRAALVAPPCPGARIPQLARWYPTGAARDAVREAAAHTRLVCSDDDPYCPGDGASAHWARPLELVTDLLPGTGHLNVDAGFGPWPAMAAWVRGERDALAPAPSRRTTPG